MKLFNQKAQTPANKPSTTTIAAPSTPPTAPAVAPIQPSKPLPQKPRIVNFADATNTMRVEDVIAPQHTEVDFDHIKIGDVYLRTLFIAGYPRFVTPGWMEPIINFDHSLDISFFIYPVEGRNVLDELRRKITEMEAEMSTDIQRGRLVNPTTEAKLEDAKMLQEQLVKGAERFFEFSFYITIPAASVEQLNSITKRVESTLGSILIVAKHTTLDMQKGFLSTTPLGRDMLSITRNMDTTSLATTFPFTTAELSSDTGVLYGINSQNDSFIIFDRFSLENSNMTVFATSGAGKSFFVKLEALRSLMLDTQVIVIDPENEYRLLTEAVGGEYINFSASSQAKINPFDLAQVYEKGENQLGLKVLSLHSLFKIIMGTLDASQEALLDKALINAYRAKGITPDPDTQTKEPPLIEDLYKALIGMETREALDLAARIEKYVRGSYVGIFDQQTNIDIKNPFTVFSIRDVQDALRPIAMFVIVDFIWTKVRKDIRKRLLIVDEAWHMMRYPDTAQFLWSIVKRARKYYLGLTTITQDVEDFLAQDIGKAVVTNSALRLLLKQSPAAIDKVAEVFYLSQGEKQLLLAANVGEGILFAGPHHAPIKVVASDEEYQFITTKPQELMQQQLQQQQQIEVSPLEAATIAKIQ
jgi:type IV secretory pathway VirB4 component